MFDLVPLSNYFFQASSFQLLKFEIYCDDHSSLCSFQLLKLKKLTAMIILHFYLGHVYMEIV